MTSRFPFLNSSATGDVSEVSHLKAENNALAEELAQCKADKDFVWSLWKRLQVASPDLTQAVGLVMQREKEKAELKDRKVLEILQMKDDKIDELQRLTTGNTKESTLILSRNLEIEDINRKLKDENKDLLEQLHYLKNKCLDLESREHFVASRQVVRDLDKELLDVKQQLSKTEIEADRLAHDKDDLTAIKDSHKQRIERLEKELKAVSDSNEKLSSEYTDTKKLLKKWENEVSVLTKDVESKNKELETVRKELSNIWQTHRQMSEHADQQAGLILQLRALHGDTQKMMKNQEEAFAMETASIQNMYQSVKAAELELRRQNLQLKEKVSQQNKLISDLHGDGDSQEDGMSGGVEDRLRAMQSELNTLRGTISSTTGSRERQRATQDKASSPVTSSSSKRGRSGSRKKSPIRQHSQSPHRESDLKVIQQKLANTERKLDDTRELLKIKSKELDELKTAHNKRLERLKSLQGNHRLVKKQMKLLEEEANGSKPKKKKAQRVAPKSLQKEDSDTVWNELTYFKTENKNLAVENLNLHEEVDTLRVKVAQDAATIHELRTCLEQEREELQFVVEQQEQDRCSTPIPDVGEIQNAKDQIERLSHQIKSLKINKEEQLRQKEEFELVKDQWDNERRNLKAEINSLRNQDSKNRIQMANLNKELSRSHRELKRKKDKKKTPVARQYQKILNQSIRHMSQMFDEFNKEGWEDVSESEDMAQTSTEVTGTTDSLGQHIVEQAQSATGDLSLCSQSPATHLRDPASERQRGSFEDHVRRLNKKHQSPSPRKTTYSLSKKKESQTTVCRDVALSPIHFLSTRPQTPRHVIGKKSNKQTPAGKLSASYLKQKLTSLQHQVNVMKSGREISIKTINDQKNLLEQLQTDLANSSHKLHGSKLTIQRLNGEIDRLHDDKECLERQLEDQNFSISGSAHSEQEWNSVQHRLKNVTSEVSRQLAVIRELKEENAQLQEKVKQSQQRISHLDRDVSQKRLLVEDMKFKLKLAQENAQSDADVMLEVENKIKTLSDSNSRYKTQIESLKQGMTAYNRERAQNEEKVFKLLEEIDRKTKLASDLQRRNGELNSTASALEKTAQHQLHVLANHSEVAIDTAQSRLVEAKSRIQEFNKFSKVLAHSLLNSLQQARLLVRQQQQRKLPAKSQEFEPMMKKAQNWACDIMDISHSDLDELMSTADEDDMSDSSQKSSDKDGRRDKRWARKWERVMQAQDFAVSLVELFMEKIEERVQLAALLQTT